MKIPQLPSFCFQTPVTIQIFSEKLSMDGDYEIVEELETKCNYKTEIGKIQSGDIMVKDYSCVAIVKGNPFNHMIKKGRIIAEGDKNEIVKVIYHKDFEGKTHYISFYLR